MKKSTLYTILAGLLALIGLVAVVGSFAVYFLPGLIHNPGQTIALSLAQLAAGGLALRGMGWAQDVAHTFLNTIEHPQWVAQRAAERFRQSRANF